MSELGRAAPPALHRHELELLRALVLRESGIALSAHKGAMIVARLGRRLREVGLATFAEYHDRALADPAELVVMLDCLTTNETRFFREPRHFHFLEEQVFPRWTAAARAGERPRRARLWSAGCSTGEEPFSLAMCARWHLPPEWGVEIVATDLSTRALEVARSATWALERAPEIRAPYLKAFMLRGERAQEGRMRAGPELRALVRFARVNLADASSRALGAFDVIFCRNVLMYLDAAVRRRAVERLLTQLAAGGCLFLGQAESLGSMQGRVRRVAPNVYVRAEGAASARLAEPSHAEAAGDPPHDGGPAPAQAVRVVVIGASTGGTEALVSLVAALPRDAPGVVVVQHLPAEFCAPFAARLREAGRLDVALAADGAEVRTGRLLLAPGGRHTTVRRRGDACVIELVDAPEASRHRPSADVLFRSAAAAVGARAVGVLLTGMGDDGADGMVELRGRGAFTIAQDEESSVVFGMPKEAIARGGAAVVAPLSRIPSLILSACRARA